MEIANPWILVSFELPAPSSQEIFNGPKVLLANALVFVKFSSAFRQPLLEIMSFYFSVTLRNLENATVFPVSPLVLCINF